MKKYFTILIAVCFTTSLFAKKVKFAVNMSAETVNAAGIHVYGDFQGAAGYPFDWDPGSTAMTQEVTDTNVYSIVVDIPAFRVYEYRFINGDQSYQTEVVPVESHVNGFFDDNRWIYVDSAANDTTFIGIIPYGANAPVGLNLVVFKVNMILENIAPEGVHIAGSFQGWDPAKSMMITFNDTDYLYQGFLPAGHYDYKFVNGDQSSGYEYVGGSCAVGGARFVDVNADIALDPVNFGSCLVGVEENIFADQLSMYPNPSTGVARLDFNDNGSSHNVVVSDLAGRMVGQYTCNDNFLRIENLEAGIYAVSIQNNLEQTANLKLTVQ